MLWVARLTGVVVAVLGTRVTAELDIAVGSIRGIGNEVDTRVTNRAERGESQRYRGTYKTKEEVEKPPVHTHPCNLTRTAVPVSFPAMKDAVFVNFLGYREPNLQYVMRCKGVCGRGDNSSDLHTHTSGCVPTKVVKKRVNMMIKSHLQGRDEREAWQEVELEEHEECGCGCARGAADQCARADMFNPRSCECECADMIWGPEREACLARTGYYWDQRTCACRNRHKKISQRHVGEGPLGGECGGGLQSFIPSNVRLHLVDVVSYIVLGSSATLAFFLFITTWYYRRKYKKLLHQDKSEKKNKYRKIDKHEEGGGGEKRRRGGGWSHPHTSHSAHSGYYSHQRAATAQAAQQCNGYATSVHQDSRHASAKSFQDVGGLHLDLVGVADDGGELYHEQYDEHGVKIEKPLTDAELMSRYLG